MKDDRPADVRAQRSRILRAIREVDRPLAMLAIRRWRNADEYEASFRDMLIGGMGFVKVSRVTPSEVFRVNKEN